MNTKHKYRTAYAKREVETARKLVRDCRVTKTEGSYYDGSYRSWQEDAIFHGWTKHARCAVGDGSMIEWVTLAVIEWPDGKVDMCEPCALQFVVITPKRF